MTAESTANKNQRSACVACLEPINSGAIICPHCGSSQKPDKWHTFSQTLKWIGGTVTIISLVLGVITLSQFYFDWKERRATVAEIVGAADWLIKSENYLQAWDMYARAAELNPSSSMVRDGRFKMSLVWVRNFEIDKSKVDSTLNDITETLYRGLGNADGPRTATILAHVGYVQVLRQINQLPVFTDVESLFGQALEADPENAYANTMYARWMLLDRPMTVERMTQAELLFNRALAQEQQRDYTRRLQMVGFTNYSYGYSDEIERKALTVLLKSSIEMMQNGEDYPHRNSRNKILDGYGKMGKAKHVEALIAALPTEAHLRAYEWLMSADNDSRPRMRNQATYIKARLNEQLGDGDKALEYYQSLLDSEPLEAFDVLVDQAIERVTGQPPARALARNYQDDPVDPLDPVGFHLATFEHFKADDRSENFTQAIAYFETRIKETPDQLSELENMLPATISRVREVVRYGDEVEQMNAYTTGFGRWEHDQARQHWVETVLLYLQLLKAEEQFERALAQLSDLLKSISILDQEWQATTGQLQYETAVLYANLANQNDNADDKEQALVFLLRAVDNGVAEQGLVSWQEIKSDQFTLLQHDSRYQNLIRGR
jgi:tetratricopeptide (TPR) repeat protein